MKRRVLEVIHWSILAFLVIASILFMIEVAPVQEAERIVTKENQILFCTNSECVDFADKIYWTFVKVFVIEIIVGGLALVAIREEISIEKRAEEHKL